MNFPRDQLKIKALVYSIFFLETVQTVIVGRDAFAVLASGWGNPARIYNMENQWLTAPIMDSLGEGFKGPGCSLMTQPLQSAAQCSFSTRSVSTPSANLAFFSV
jgi:hypothetical protein